MGENINMKVRIEIHLEVVEATALDQIAKAENRSRKNYCENEIRKLISEYIKTKKQQ